MNERLSFAIGAFILQFGTGANDTIVSKRGGRSHQLIEHRHTITVARNMQVHKSKAAHRPQDA